MKALRFYDTGNMRIEDIEEPEVPPGSLKMAVNVCGVCGSDVTAWGSGSKNIPINAPDPRTGVQAPVTIGHEVVETVVEVGAGVEGFSVGDRVTVRGVSGCGDCDRCRAGQGNFCRNLWMHGFNTGTGGFAEFDVAPAEAVHRLPDSVSDQAGALIEPFCVALHGIRHSGFRMGDDAIVFGGGPIGLLAVQALRIGGAQRIVMVEPRKNRQAAGLHSGADVVLDPTSQDVVEAVMDLTHGRGMDYAYELAGVESALQAALLSVRPHGTVVNIAAWGGKSATIDPMVLLMAERHLTASLGYTAADFEYAIRLIADGRLSPEWMVSREVPLDEIVEKGFAGLANEKAGQDGELIKVLARVS